MVVMKFKPGARTAGGRSMAAAGPSRPAGSGGADSTAGTGTPPAWMAVGLSGLARMSPKERLIAVENIEALVLAAYGEGPTPALCGPGAQERSRDVLIRLGWAEPGIFLRAPVADVLARLRIEIARSGLV